MSDLISRQAAIDALDKIESEVADGYGYQYEKWRKYFCGLPSAQRWIPCSERLSEENGEYLVTRESSSYRYIDIVRKSNCNSHLPMASDIKAWMPLPEPYEGVKE